MKYEVVFDNGNKQVIEDVARILFEKDYVVFQNKKREHLKGIGKRNLLSYTLIKEGDTDACTDSQNK